MLSVFSGIVSFSMFRSSFFVFFFVFCFSLLFFVFELAVCVVQGRVFVLLLFSYFSESVY